MVEVSPGAACGTAAPALAGEAARKPEATGYAALAAQISAQATATTLLQEQLGAVLAEGQRREQEARQREAETRQRELQLQEEAARRQAENSALIKALSDNLTAVQLQ